MNTHLINEIDAILPQTQCGKCSFNGCRPYAEAISQGTADINQCPPGGDAGIQQLAKLLNVPIKPLNPEHGTVKPRQIAVINEADCIGCTKCLPPCPVDAIIGANKLMHTAISQQCTGCELCIAPCPVNCISMVDAEQPAWTQADANKARSRYLAKNKRLERLAAEKAERLQRQKQQLLKLKLPKH